MKLATVERDNRSVAVVDVGGGEAAVLTDEFTDVETLIRVPEQVRRSAVQAASDSRSRLTLADAAWRPPVVRPGKVLCVALNHSSNPDRILSGPDTPAMFTKPASSLVGHGRPIRLRADDGRVHPEPELAVVIGRTAVDVPADDGLAYVFGYTILNDVTAPDLRATDTFHYGAVHPGPQAADGVRHVESWVSYPARYKGADTFAPLGPWVVTADEIPDPHALRITCSVNGELVTDDNTSHLRFHVADVIAFASRYLTLEPGDVIGMGTALAPSDTGRAVQNVDLNRPGSRVEISIAGIGVLSNPVERR